MFLGLKICKIHDFFVKHSSKLQTNDESMIQKEKLLTVICILNHLKIYNMM